MRRRSYITRGALRVVRVPRASDLSASFLTRVGLRLQGQGAQWLGMGLGVFGLVAFAAKLNDKQSSVPFAPKEFPFNNLAIELGRSPPPPK